MAVDVMTYSHTVNARFYQGGGVQRIRYYRVPFGTPVMPITTSFMYQRQRGGLQTSDPQPGTIGVLPSTDAYDKGAVPTGVKADGTYVGTAKQWLDGSTTEPPLVWGFNGQSTACADQQKKKVMQGRRQTPVVDGLVENVY